MARKYTVSKRDQRTRRNIIMREKYQGLRRAGYTSRQAMKYRMYSDKRVNTLIAMKNKKRKKN